MIKEEGKLPDKPSALIQLALEDLEKAERSELYDIDMSIWHQPRIRTGFEISPCTVCLAGSVIAFSLGVLTHRNVTPKSFRADTEVKLEALEDFRTGHIQPAIRLMCGWSPGIYLLPDRILIPDYREYPEILRRE